jgi:hypothetical protein
MSPAVYEMVKCPEEADPRKEMKHLSQCKDCRKFNKIVVGNSGKEVDCNGSEYDCAG